MIDILKKDTALYMMDEYFVKWFLLKPKELSNDLVEVVKDVYFK